MSQLIDAVPYYKDGYLIGYVRELSEELGDPFSLTDSWVAIAQKGTVRSCKSLKEAHEFLDRTVDSSRPTPLKRGA